MIFFLLLFGFYFIPTRKLYIASVADGYIWGAKGISMILWDTVLHMTVSICLAIGIAFLITKIKPSVEKKPCSYLKFYPITSTIVLFMMVIYYSSIFLGKYLGNNVEIITLNMVFLFSISLSRGREYSISNND
ncbi:hypothetical protein CKN80_07860 [Carnobacterium divergens]|nr:hypothetical protein CKN79_09385 [Carnobacterium divergens]TFJ50877.1 hypothetical protein CKN80_07860 [Carnobacterium divergens]